MSAIRIIPGQLSEVGTTQLLPLGTRYIDETGDEYRYVKFASLGGDAAGATIYAATVATATYGEVTTETSAGTGAFTGVCMGVPVASSYGWVQTHGLGAANYVSAEEDTTALTEVVALSNNTDGNVEGSASAAYTLSSVGISLAGNTGTEAALATVINSLFW